MSKYLKNDICNFEIEFDLDPNNKIDILCTCFFKMNEHYKKFNHYVNGLIRLIDLVNSQSKYKLRIFIDQNVRDDEYIYKLLKSSDKIQIVVYKCANYMKGKYHVDLFGSLVRLFPLFDFDNNDSNNVIVIDVDILPEDIKTLKSIISLDITDKQIIGKGRAEDLIIKKIQPHFYCNLCGFFNKKYSKKIITDFISNAENIKDVGLYGVRKTPFGFGVDELFLNKYFIYYDNNKNLSDVKLGVIFNYDMNWFLYYYKKDLMLESERITNELLKLILGKFYKKGMDTNKMFNYIDRNIYGKNDSNYVKRYLSDNFYKLIKDLVKSKIEWFGRSNMELIDKYYRGIYSSTSIVYFNPETYEIKNVINIPN